MPPRTEPELSDLQADLRRRIIRSTADALDFLLEQLPAGRPKHNQVLALLGRAEQIRQFQIGNTRPLDQILVLENELREDALLFIDHLQLRDFADAPPVRPELKPGHLLYRVPPQMQLRQQHECLVRIAHTLEQVRQGLEEDQVIVTETVPVAEVMQVEIIDPSPTDARAFDILLVSDGEQLVDEYSYTEWVFYVRPLLAGQHDLVLKVSVLLTINGKERTKNVVFRRRIAVGTEVAAAPAAELRRVVALAPTAGEEDAFLPPPVTPRMSTRGGETKAAAPQAPYVPYAQPAPAPLESRPTRSARPLRRWLSVAASLLVVVLAGWWVVQTTGSEHLSPSQQEPPPIRHPDIGDSASVPSIILPDEDTLSVDRDTIQ
jgi:hypothetical protein